jgi:hypothetical protein
LGTKYKKIPEEIRGKDKGRGWRAKALEFKDHAP